MIVRARDKMSRHARRAGSHRMVPAIKIMSTSITIMIATTLLLLQTRAATSLAPSTSFISHRVSHHSASFDYRVVYPYPSPWVLRMSQDDNADEPSTSSTSTKSPSKRAARKAAERDKKQLEAKYINPNKATSKHPEAILKRQQPKQPTNRRKHNFAERAKFLTEVEEGSEEFDTDVDGLTTVSINAAGFTNDGGEHMVHPLHSTAVDKLDAASTTAEEVVKAIKRAQNLHDVHDTMEIAHFLLEKVGTFINSIDAFCNLLVLSFVCIHLKYPLIILSSPILLLMHSS